MAWGLRTTSDYGTVQIDDQYMSPHLVQKASLTFMSASAYSDTYQTGTGTPSYAIVNEDQVYLYFRVHGYRPIVAVKPPAGKMCASSSIGAWKNTVTAPMYTLGDTSQPYQDYVFAMDASGSHTITVYLFDQTPLDEGSGMGLIVKNSASEVVFNSEMRPIRILGVMPVGLDYLENSLAVDSTREYAWTYARTMQGSFSSARFNYTTGTNSWVPTLFQPNSGSIEVGALASSAYPNQDGTPRMIRDDLAMVIDVTGY